MITRIIVAVSCVPMKYMVSVDYCYLANVEDQVKRTPLHVFGTIPLRIFISGLAIFLVEKRHQRLIL